MAMAKAKKGLAASKIRATQKKRSPRAKVQDAKRKHSVVVGMKSPKTKVWARNPGKLDIRGIDTPKKKKR